MGVKNVYRVSNVYNFYAGCTMVAPDCARSATGIKNERRPVILALRFNHCLGKATYTKADWKYSAVVCMQKSPFSA